MYCPVCGTQNPDVNVMCDSCKQPLRPFAPNPQMQMQGHSSNNTLGGLIPANNPSALISYYLGIFSLFPLFGFFMGVAAVYLGVKGLKLYKANPAVRGRTHAWVGISCGAIFGLFNFLLLVAVILAFLNRASTG